MIRRCRKEAPANFFVLRENELCNASDLFLCGKELLTQEYSMEF